MYISLKKNISNIIILFFNETTQQHPPPHSPIHNNFLMNNK